MSRDPGTPDAPLITAFYLPQFHPIPENDQHWGPGFTEWRNVVRATPAFRGHAQPRLPGELGFYDLRCVETQQAQAELAAQYGVDAFCYYHYWFDGRRVLERPAQQMLSEPAIHQPFFFCWANEDWTRSWDGRTSDVLLRQRYSEDDDLAHVRALLPYFADRRYVRFRGALAFAIYRARQLPDPARTAEVWRKEVARAGLGDLHLIAIESFVDEIGDPCSIGFDSSVEFQPNWQSLRSLGRRRRLGQTWARLNGGGHRVFNYSDLAEAAMARDDPEYCRFGGVTPRWDNTARRAKDGIIFQGSTPEIYQGWLSHVISRARRLGHEAVFINAWNEWAEGAYLEPDIVTGRRYLEATAEALRSGSRSN